MQLVILFNLVCWSLTWVKLPGEAEQNKLMIYHPNVDNRLAGDTDGIEKWITRA
jgi:hypothetical protein